MGITSHHYFTSLLHIITSPTYDCIITSHHYYTSSLHSIYLLHIITSLYLFTTNHHFTLSIYYTSLLHSIYLLQIITSLHLFTTHPHFTPSIYYTYTHTNTHKHTKVNPSFYLLIVTH